MKTRQQRLLLLAEQVGSIDADLGSATAQAWLVSAVDALAHAVVDLADGKQSATIEVPVLALDSSSHEDLEADRASCAAAASQARRAHVALTSALEAPDGIPQGLAADTIRSLSVLAGALQDLATHPSSSDHERSVRAGAHRSLRTAYRLVQPAGSSGTVPK
ncbi:MAG: hypothetical protein WBG89_07650 [Ornithinimicrobium sp.]